jgi:hypothetical protein
MNAFQNWVDATITLILSVATSSAFPAIVTAAVSWRVANRRGPVARRILAIAAGYIVAVLLQAVLTGRL